MTTDRPTTPAAWRATVIAALVRVNDRQRVLVNRWRPPGWTRYDGTPIPRPEHTPAALRETADALDESAAELATVARACRTRADALDAALTRYDPDA